MPNVRQLSLVFGLALSAVAPGCASRDDRPQTEDELDWSTPHAITLEPNAVLAPHAVSDVAVVQDGAIVLPTDGANGAAVNGWIGKIEAGKVIAGDRDQRGVDGSTNPTGFLRHVVAVDRQPDKIVITTTQAYLDDLIADGDLVFDSANESQSIFAQIDGVSLVPQALHPLGEPTGGTSSGSATTSPGHSNVEWEDEDGSSASVGPSASFDIQKVAFNAKVDGTIKFRKWWKVPTGVERLALKLTLDPEIEADFDVGVTMGRSFSSSSFKGKKLFPTIPIPMGGPIPTTLRIEAGFLMSVSAAGSFTAHGKGKGEGHAAIGFRYENGLMTNTSEAPTFDTSWEISQLSGKATFAVDAGPYVGLKLLAFDAGGFEGKLGLYDNLTGELCTVYDLKSGKTKDGFDVKTHWGPKLEVNGLVQVPFIDSELVNVPLLTAETHTADQYLVGGPESCEIESEAEPVTPETAITGEHDTPAAFKAIDSCKGREDGAYCSEIYQGGGFICKDQQILYGLQCPQPAKCTGPNGAGATILCDGQPLGGGGGDAGAPTGDTCAGKADGIYCSVLSASSAYECKGGSTAAGYQCPSGKTCKGPNGPGSAIVCN